jgi:hypothetical protein
MRSALDGENPRVKEFFLWFIERFETGERARCALVVTKAQRAGKDRGRGFRVGPTDGVVL